jgi:allantoin racemase
MKILVINPNTSDEMTAGIDASAKMYARPDTKIVTKQAKEGARSFESAYEEVLSAMEVFRLVKEANERKYDAVVLACFGDPHITGSREISDIPIYGIAQASMHLASIIGNKFSVVAPSKWMKPAIEQSVRHLGLETRLASVRTMQIPVLTAERDRNSDSFINSIVEASRKAIDEDYAEVIILGCSVLAGLDKKVEKILKAPVLDGVVCAVKLAEACHDYGLSHSKVGTYRKPASKQWLGMEEFRI